MPDKGTQVKMEEIDCGAGQPITVLRFIGDITSLSQAAVLGTYQGLPDTAKKSSSTSPKSSTSTPAASPSSSR